MIVLQESLKRYRAKIQLDMRLNCTKRELSDAVRKHFTQMTKPRDAEVIAAFLRANIEAKEARHKAVLLN